MNSRTWLGVILPEFLSRWLQQSCNLLCEKRGIETDPALWPSTSSNKQTTQCLFSTEITNVNFEKIRCRHPNYRGGGPWRDWVVAKFVSDGVPGAYEYLCQVILFAHLNRTDQETPTHAVLRVTHRQSNDDKAASSVLFSHWKKRFHQGRPLLQLVPLSQFVRIAGVVDEHPEMIKDVKFLSEYMGKDEYREMLLVNERCLRYSLGSTTH